MPKIRLLRSAPKHRSHRNNKFVDKNRWNKFYQSKAWKKLREAKLHDHPLCERCLENDIIKAATCVHHDYEFSNGITEQEQWEIFLDYDNLVSLCDQCHQLIHKTRWKNKGSS